MIQTLLTPKNTPPDTAKVYKHYFVFAATVCIWAFGGFVFQDQVCLCTCVCVCVCVCVYACVCEGSMQYWVVISHFYLVRMRSRG